MDSESQRKFHRTLAVAETPPQRHVCQYTMDDLSSPELRAMSLEEALVYVFGGSQTPRYQDLMRIDLRHLKWSVPGHTQPHRLPTKDEVILIHLVKAEGWALFGGGPMWF